MKYIVLLSSILFLSGGMFTKEQLVILSVPRMNCATCPVTVKKALQKVEGVTSVNVIYKSKMAEVSFNDEVASVSYLQKTTNDTGYPSHLVKANE
ncbi:MAG: cation transporter [Thiotrichales bacterium]|nr:cation transporter [Thiotrichales bacterium]